MNSTASNESQVPAANGHTIVFDETAQRYVYTVTFEYEPEKKAWFPRVSPKPELQITETLLEAQQSIYRVPGVDDKAPFEKPGEKRKKEKQSNSLMPKTKKPKPEAKKKTAVYVTGLPSDATESEIADVFSKGGVFLLDPITGNPKIKLYKDEKESIAVACQLLDDTPLRFGDKVTMKVAPAVFQEKTEPTPNHLLIDKKIKAKAIQKLQKKLGWFEEKEIPAKALKTVILKRMFALKDLQDDPTLLLDLKQDVREECMKFGEVTNTMEEDGIMSVRFKAPESATACVQKMNGRYFDGREIQAFLSTGREKFRRSKGGDDDDKQRQESYAEWLESQADE